jgi:FixJ family two-component response regulator
LASGAGTLHDGRMPCGHRRALAEKSRSHVSQATPVVFVVDDASVPECLGPLIIFVGSPTEMPAAVQAVNAGAAEFFLPPAGDDLRLKAIRQALDRSRAALGQESALQALQDRHASLSRREREVMALVVSGRLNKQVGAELGISEITVKAHRGQVMRKMKAESLPDLVRMSSRLGLA